MHVKNSGLKVWNQDTEVISKVECPEYKNEIDQIKATPDGKFVIVGFPNTGFIMFFRIEYELTDIRILPNGKISVSTFLFLTFYCYRCNIQFSKLMTTFQQSSSMIRS